MPTYRTEVNDDRQFIIDVNIFSHDGRHRHFSGDSKPRTYRALIDTGATISAISDDVVSDLGVHSEKTQRIRTVSQTHIVPTYDVGITLPNAGAHKIFPLSAGSLGDKSAFGFDALLGMDILENFHITIDNGKITISI